MGSSVLPGYRFDPGKQSFTRGKAVVEIHYLIFLSADYTVVPARAPKPAADVVIVSTILHCLRFAFGMLPTILPSPHLRDCAEVEQ